MSNQPQLRNVQATTDDLCGILEGGWTASLAAIETLIREQVAAR